jgi:hypothetical protein
MRHKMEHSIHERLEIAKIDGKYKNLATFESMVATVGSLLELDSGQHVIVIHCIEQGFNDEQFHFHHWSEVKALKTYDEYLKYSNGIFRTVTGGRND